MTTNIDISRSPYGERRYYEDRNGDVYMQEYPNHWIIAQSRRCPESIGMEVRNNPMTGQWECPEMEHYYRSRGMSRQDYEMRVLGNYAQSGQAQYINNGTASTPYYANVEDEKKDREIKKLKKQLAETEELKLSEALQKEEEANEETKKVNDLISYYYSYNK